MVIVCSQDVFSQSYNLITYITHNKKYINMGFEVYQTVPNTEKRPVRVNETLKEL